jgi:outer membrane protein
MKKLFLILCICFILPVSAQAEEAIKIGILDLQKVLNECDAGKKAKTDLEALIKSKESAIEKKGVEIEKLKSELQKQVSVLSAEARKSKEDELEKLLRDYQRIVQDSQAEVKKKEGELTEAIIKGVHDLVDEMGKKEGYTVIIEKTLSLYANEDLDITDDVIKRYNKSKK